MLSLPSPSAYVMRGVRWGRADDLGTAAFWYTQARWAALRSDAITDGSHALGRTLEEEVAACILGGYGIPATVGLVAYEALRDSQLLTRRRATADSDLTSALHAVLARPLNVNGRQVRYRFASQRARALSESLRILARERVPHDVSDVEMRDWLLRLPGVGLKTASWITRNVRSSNAVAILDVHIVRAGRAIGVFRSADDPARHYRAMEQRFLTFAEQLGVAASTLDAVMWRALRRELPAT